MSNLYLDFRQILASDRKTSIWNVHSTSSDDVLGSVRWYGRWRQYTFYPTHDTIWNPDCLHAVAEFCHEQTRLHRAQGKMGAEV